MVGLRTNLYKKSGFTWVLPATVYPPTINLLVPKTFFQFFYIDSGRVFWSFSFRSIFRSCSVRYWREGEVFCFGTGDEMKSKPRTPHQNFRPQWIFQVPLKGGIGGIVHPPIGRKNTTYIPLIVLAFWGVI